MKLTTELILYNYIIYIIYIIKNREIISITLKKYNQTTYFKEQQKLFFKK